MHYLLRRCFGINRWISNSTKKTVPWPGTTRGHTTRGHKLLPKTRGQKFYLYSLVKCECPLQAPGPSTLISSVFELNIAVCACSGMKRIEFTGLGIREIWHSCVASFSWCCACLSPCHLHLLWSQCRCAATGHLPRTLPRWTIATPWMSEARFERVRFNCITARPLIQSAQRVTSFLSKGACLSDVERLNAFQYLELRQYPMVNPTEGLLLPCSCPHRDIMFLHAVLALASKHWWKSWLFDCLVVIRYMEASPLTQSALQVTPWTGYMQMECFMSSPTFPSNSSRIPTRQCQQQSIGVAWQRAAYNYLTVYCAARCRLYWHRLASSGVGYQPSWTSWSSP